MAQAAQGVVESPSLKVLKNDRHVALGAVGSGHRGDGLGILKSFSNLNDSVIVITGEE